MKKTVIIISIALTVIIIAYFVYKTQQQKAITDRQQSNVDMINAQTQQQLACDKSWQCTTANLLGSLDGIISLF